MPNKSLMPSAKLRTITSTWPAAACTVACTAALVVDCIASGSNPIEARETPVLVSTRPSR